MQISKNFFDMNGEMMIRLLSIELENFRNVEHGRIEFCKLDDIRTTTNTANITGIYGQNGSGKTSVISALGIIKDLIWGQALSDRAYDCIAVDKDSCSIQITFYSQEREPDEDDGLFEYVGIYSIKLTREDKKAYLSGEKIQFKELNGKSSLRTLFEYNELTTADTDNTPSPTTLWKSLLSKASLRAKFDVAEALSYNNKTSILFGDPFSSLTDELEARYYSEEKTPETYNKAFDSVIVPLMIIYFDLKLFSYEDLAVIEMSHQALSSLNFINLVSHEGNRFNKAGRTLRIDISRAQVVPNSTLTAIQNTLTSTNEVLGALIPGLSLHVKKLGTSIMDDGEEGTQIEIMSRRDEKEVPFRCESEGVKKIVTILVSLIDVYSNPSACVAIDELDSGIFEFLLGEILEVLKEYAKGQLIFTAHNLRPLETLPSNCLIFTTTNPENRYIPFKGLRDTNNMRDQYLRAINIGGQNEIIYEPTSKYEIDGAFDEASATMMALLTSEDE